MTGYVEGICRRSSYVKGYAFGSTPTLLHSALPEVAYREATKGMKDEDAAAFDFGIAIASAYAGNFMMADIFARMASNRGLDIKEESVRKMINAAAQTGDATKNAKLRAMNERVTVRPYNVQERFESEDVMLIVDPLLD